MTLKIILCAAIGVLLFLIGIGIYAAIVARAREDEMKQRLLKRLHKEMEKRDEAGEE